MKILSIVLPVIVCALIGMTDSVIADPNSKANDNVVPAHELEIAQSLSADGPTETIGIGSSKLLGSMPLAGEFEGADGFVLRAREITLLPGGQVAVHQHTSRPGVAYILEGEAVEHRNDTNGPLTRTTGAVAFEKTGTIHWWKNESSAEVKVLVVDIVPSDIK